MTVSTRLARAADIGPIVTLWKRFMAEEHEAVPDADPEGAEARWTARLQTQVAESKVVVADRGDALVGFLAFIDHRDRQWVPPGIAYVVDVYVAPEARRTAAARELFRAAADRLRPAYSETWTNTHAGNRRMQLLLRRAGFKPLVGFEIEGLRDQVYYRRDNQARRRGGPIPIKLSVSVALCGACLAWL